MAVPPLFSLPPELAQEIFEFLPESSLRSCNLVCKWTREFSSNILWRDVILTDRRRWHDIPDELEASWRSHDGVPAKGQEQEGHHSAYSFDSHDDTPMIRTLFILAKYPEIAAKVTSITHRCHLPPPNFLTELGYIGFAECTLSNSWKTLQLLRLAVANLKNVRTLRLIAPHHFIGVSLIREFLNKNRPRQHRLQHLWLECMSWDTLFKPTLDLGSLDVTDELEILSYLSRSFELRFPELKTLRVRRLHWEDPRLSSLRSRCGKLTDLRDGRGCFYTSTIECSGRPGLPASHWFNERIWNELPEIRDFLHDQTQRSPLSLDDLLQDEGLIRLEQNCNGVRPASRVQDQHGLLRTVGSRSPPDPTFSIDLMLRASLPTLTSLCLDWIVSDIALNHWEFSLYCLMGTLSHMHFPHLRAFQWRNAVVASTQLPSDVYLFSPTEYSFDEDGGDEFGTGLIDFPNFINRHKQLNTLAWPMDRFFAPRKTDVLPDYDFRHSQEVIETLGERLITLRIDTELSEDGEPHTDTAEDRLHDPDALKRRRRFIAEFAPYMKKLQCIKMEGGIPKDEQRQVLHALRQCPLKKVVQINYNNPLGNFWGEYGHDLNDAAGEFDILWQQLLEAEPQQALEDARKLVPTNASRIREPSAPFEPVYGEVPSVSLLYTLASHFGSTITELKFCGYNGAPVLRIQTPITSALLWHLRYFPNLRHLTTSIQIVTTFQHDWHQADVIDCWMAERKLHTTPVRAPPGWEESQVRDEGFDHMRSVYNRIPFIPERYAELPTASRTHSDFNEGPDRLNGDADMHPDLLDWTQPPTAPEMNPPPQDPSNAETPSPHPDDLLADFIHENFSPHALASQVYELIGPHLSPLAKARKGSAMGEDGVHVRILFCIGVDHADIFEFETWIDNEGVCGFRGPVEEGNWERWKGNLEKRAWFGTNLG